MRCVAHIVNLIVSDGLEEIGVSVVRIREALRWVRASPSRMMRFKNCVNFHGIKSKKIVILDVPTRWNSTYMMLEAAEKFEKAFKTLALENSEFVADLTKAKKYKGQVIGPPTTADWKSARNLSKHLRYFYELTLLVSGTKYVTSHLFLRQLFAVFFEIKQMEESEEEEVKNMASRMHAKLCKYWHESEEGKSRMNRLFYLAVVFDPRHKMHYPVYALRKLYGETRGDELIEELNGELTALFKLYESRRNNVAATSREGTQSEGSSMTRQNSLPTPNVLANSCDDDYSMTEAAAKASELERYLVELREGDGKNPKYDILLWWKNNAARYPILSEMAKDLLVVPISGVASESAFSTGARVLDSFRSSLTPKIVEALICTEDWLAHSNLPLG
ncbi:unnamed protein product [Linum tenue]|uniref:Transposase n=1 Tax=Linum tenue TaxID=586396 RepID=A0AAV0PIW1_9ROSI|nr:unnamed protein product [Linum tenue]